MKLSAVKEILHEIGLSGMTVLDVKGFGRQRGLQEQSNNDYDDEFLAKIKIEIIVEDKAKNLDPETIYFLTKILNNLNLKKIRNVILSETLPLKV